MAYVAASTRSAGALITAAIWNQDVVANVIACAALGGMSAFRVYTSGATWTKPSGLKSVLIMLVGAGGGGGGTNGTNTRVGAGGGSGNGAMKFSAAASLGGTETVTIGVGGAGGVVGTSYVGVAGGLTSFGSHATAGGGNGGLDAQSASQQSGISGTVTGDVTVFGQNGDYNGAPGDGASGEGGSTPFGLGIGGVGVGLTPAGGPSFNGGPGRGYGAGGGGGCDPNGASPANGGLGKDGLVLVYEFVGPV